VALIVESGLVGAMVLAGFLLYLFARAAYARRLGRSGGSVVREAQTPWFARCTGVGA